MDLVVKLLELLPMEILPAVWSLPRQLGEFTMLLCIISHTCSAKL